MVYNASLANFLASQDVPYQGPALTNEQIVSGLQSFPGATDAEIAAAAQYFGVSPTQLAQATQLNPQDVQSRFDAAVATNQDIQNRINEAYRNIGITSADRPGSDYWTSQLQSGAIRPEDFTRQFLTAASGVTDPTYASNVALAQQQLGALNRAYTEETGLLHQGSLGNVTDRDNRTYDTATILNLANQIAPNVGSLSGGIFATRGESVGFGFDEASRILGREANPVDQVILDMARNLNQMGVTDLRQVQVRPTIGDANVQYRMDEFGQPTGYYIGGGGAEEGSYLTRSLTPEEIARIETRTVNDLEGGTVTERFIRGIPTSYSLYAADRLLAQSPISPEGLAYQIGKTYSGPGMTGYRIVMNPTTGTPQFTTYGSDTGQGALISAALTMASFIPGVQPFAQAAGALWAASQGNTIGALASLAGMGGYNNVSTALNVANAVDRGDLLSAATSLMSNSTISNSVGNVTLDGNITLRDVGNAANLVNSISTGNVSGMLSSAGALTNSADLNTAAAAVRVITAIESGNIAGAVNAAAGLNNTLNAANNLNNREVVTNIASSVAEGVNSGTDEATTWGSIYNSAITAGASEQEAIDAANFISSTNESSLTPVNVSSTSDTAPAGFETEIEGVTQTGPDDFAGFDQAARDTAERTTLNIANDQADSLEEAAALAGARGFTSFNYAGNNYQVSASTAELASQIASAEIAAQTNFSDAYRTAREYLGPGKVFEWNGNQYSTDTREENPSLAAASDQIRAANMGVANGRGTYAGYDESAVDQALTSLGTFDEFMRATTEDGQKIVVDDKISKDLITPLVRVFGLTTRATGELAESLAGSLVAINALDKDSPILKAATQLKNSSAHAVGNDIAQAEKNVFERVSAANGAIEKGKELFRAMWDNPITIFTLPFNEGVQEIVPLLTGVGAAKWLGTVAGLATSAGVNAAEAAGANYNETVSMAKRSGMSDEDAHAAGQKSALAAGTVAAVLGPAAELPFIKRAAGDLASEAAGSVVKRAVGAGTREAVTEYPEEALASIASDYFATGTVDLNKALTQGTIASVTAGKTVGAYSVVTDVMADRPATDQILSSGAVTDTQRPVVDQTITTALQNNQNLADAGNQISSSLIEAGISEEQANNIANTVVAEQLINNIRSEGTEFNIENLNQAVGVDANGNAVTVGDLIGSSITNRGTETFITPDVVIGTNAQGGVMTLGDLSTVQTTTTPTDVQTETSTAGDVTTSVDPNTGATTTINTNAETNVTTETTTQGNTETTTVTDPNANTATRTETNAETNTQVTTTNDVNTNTVTQTTVDPNTSTQVTVDTNTNTTTQVTTDNNTNTQTTVHTDPVNNTQITTVVDGNTGEIIDETITEVPDDWSPPSIDAPPVTSTTTTQTTRPRVQQPRRIPQMLAAPTILKETEYISDDDLTFKDPFISSKVGQERFKGSLDPFLAQVESDRLAQEFNQLTQQNIRGGEDMTNYFTYGVPIDIDQVFQTVPSSLENKAPANDEGPTLMAAARGGLATPLMAAGGYAGGGLPVVAHSGKARVDFREGAAVSGPGDGQSDDIPAMLADGEFVFPADVVAALGNGSTKAGSEKLYDMMHSIRAHHRSAKPKDLPPPAKKNPLDYLKKARR
jgi:hypothetical protein